MSESNRSKTTRKLHKYVFILLGLWLTFLISAAIAALRVSQSAKFSPFRFYGKSLTMEEQENKADH